MKSSAKNISLTSLDDLFSTEEERSKDVVGSIVNIPLSQLHDFPNHPFKVRDDEKMQETVESVKAYGILVPAIVRQRTDGDSVNQRPNRSAALPTRNRAGSV